MTQREQQIHQPPQDARDLVGYLRDLDVTYYPVDVIDRALSAAADAIELLSYPRSDN